MGKAESAPLRVAIYCRVSSVAEADADAVDLQRDQLTKHAARLGWTVVTICEDVAVSGTVEAEDRPGLSCVVEAARAGEIDAVLIRGLDRLARKLTTQEATLMLLWRAGIAIHTVAGEVLADDPDDPMRTAMRQMAGVFAELERATVVQRLRRGRDAKAAAGGFAHGSPAYGLDLVDGELIPNEHETAVLARIRSERESGRTLTAIADGLNADGIATKRGGRWHPSTVSRTVDADARARTNEQARSRTAARRMGARS